MNVLEVYSPICSFCFWSGSSVNYVFLFCSCFLHEFNRQ